MFPLRQSECGRLGASPITGTLQSLRLGGGLRGTRWLIGISLVSSTPAGCNLRATRGCSSNRAFPGTPGLFLVQTQKEGAPCGTPSIDGTRTNYCTKVNTSAPQYSVGLEEDPGA